MRFRPVFHSAGTAGKGDGRADARGMFIAAAAASPAYELLGRKGPGTPDRPPVEAGLLDGDLACASTPAATRTVRTGRLS